MKFRERSMGKFWQQNDRVETRGLEGWDGGGAKERTMMGRQMKARDKMKYEEVGALGRIEHTVQGSLIHL